MSELPDLPIWITGIALAKNLDGRLEMATLASSNGWRQVWRRWESLEGGWTRWQPLGGESGTGLHQSAPALALNHDGRLEAALVAEDRTLWHAWQRYPGRAWTEWYRLETPPGRIELQNTPVLARNQDGRLEAFVRGSSRDDRFVSVWHSWQVEAGADSWSEWSNLGHPPEFGVPDFAVAQNQDGRLELFAAADNGRVRRAWFIWQRSQSQHIMVVVG